MAERHIGEILAEKSSQSFVGRQEELNILLGTLGPGGPPVIFVHGLGGIGKSSLLEAFGIRARAQGATIVRLDCRAIEPTERGFLHALSTATGSDVDVLETQAERLSRLGNQVVLALDTYELFRLMDTWVRQTFVPALGENVRVMLFGREPPVSAWLASPGWQGLFRNLRLDSLGEHEALEMLVHTGLSERDAMRVNRFARGHPLALKLAAAALRERSFPGLKEVAVQQVVGELTRIYLSDVSDPLTREALDAASVVRRTTISLLHAMLPHTAPQDTFERLCALPFVQIGNDGLVIHDAVREAIGTALRSSDPSRYRAYRRAAWSQLRTEVRTAGRSELWRYTADMLYIIENPVVREAFFPSDAHLLAVEPAVPDDGPLIHDISERHDGPQATALLDTWWQHVPRSFSVVRDRHGMVVGFYCMFDPTTLDQVILKDDPVVWYWWQHFRHYPVTKNQRVLFLRRWLSLEHGDMPSPVQAACWLDIKRTYMEIRPSLRRVYLTVRDLSTYAPIAMKLGIRPIDSTAELDGATYHLAMLDMGPSSVDGWLAGLVAAELGIEEDDFLDREARELVIDGQRVRLTRLEFAVMQHLYQREGKAVTRASLLENVWGYDYDGGSNVVDVIVKSLRKKMGKHASMIETVTGLGYSFRKR